MTSVGYSIGWTALSAVIIYAGSMQIVMVALLVSGVPFLTAAMMTLFVNARHVFYGIGMIDRFKGQGLRFPFMVFALTDEAYSILCSYNCPDEFDSKSVDFYICLFAYLFWVMSCCLGALFGGLIPLDMHGIEFSATIFFTVVVINQWLEFKSRIPVFTGLISALFFLLLLGPDNFILPALSVSLIALMLLRGRIALKMEGVEK